jgi:tRNA modification GTPase
LERARQADLVLWLQDGSAAPAGSSSIAAVEMLRVITKIDLPSFDPAVVAPGALGVSSQTGVGLDQLTAAIIERARGRVGRGDAVAPTQARHRTHLERTGRHLSDFLEGAGADLELRAEDLRLAATELGRLTGRIDPEDVLAEIFGRFCIGK